MFAEFGGGAPVRPPEYAPAVEDCNSDTGEKSEAARFRGLCKAADNHAELSTS